MLIYVWVDFDLRLSLMTIFVCFFDLDFDLICVEIKSCFASDRFSAVFEISAEKFQVDQS